MPPLHILRFHSDTFADERRKIFIRFEGGSKKEAEENKMFQSELSWPETGLG